MSRRDLVALLLPQSMPQQPDPWQYFGEVWNPFAAKLNIGVMDLKLWSQVRKRFHVVEKTLDKE